MIKGIVPFSLIYSMIFTDKDTNKLILNIIVRTHSYEIYLFRPKQMD